MECHNTVFCAKQSAIFAQAVYFLHSTMPSVTCLRLRDVSVICRVTYDTEALKTTQEEADTRLLLHAQHASEADYRAIGLVITAEDTDVMVLCMSFRKMSCSLYQMCGTQIRTRYVHIGKVAGSFKDNICQGLIGLHTFSGCDT